MTPDVSTTNAFSTVKSRRQQWVLTGALVLVVIGAVAGGIVWWSWPKPQPLEPPMPPEIQDGEVRLVVQRARQEVLDNPNSAATWGKLGMTLIAHVYDREADRCFEEAARLAPGDAHWTFARASIAVKLNPERAVPLLRQAVAESESWPDAASDMRMKLAETLFEQQQMDEAEALFQEELRRDPQNPRATFGLGLVTVARGNDPAAEKYLTAVKSHPCATKKATAQLAAIAGRRGDRATAAELNKEVANLVDDFSWPDPFLQPLHEYRVGTRYWDRKIEELESTNQFIEAADLYLRQIEVKPTSSAYVGAGGDLALAGDFDRALPLLREGIRLDPENPNAFYALALAQYRRATASSAQFADSAQVKEWLRDAADNARRATQIKPDHARAYLFWGLALRRLEEPAKAIEPLRQGVACHPEMLELQITLGEVYLDVGQDREAETYLENARRLDPKDIRLVKDFERLRNKKN
jgi:tetratricopeptide (TPR) repeat protein